MDTEILSLAQTLGEYLGNPDTVIYVIGFGIMAITILVLGLVAAFFILIRNVFIKPKTFLQSYYAEKHQDQAFAVIRELEIIAGNNRYTVEKRKEQCRLFILDFKSKVPDNPLIDKINIDKIINRFRA